MKKYLSIICAAMLCVCCLAFAACSSGSGSAASAGESASASSESSADPADAVVGEWKFAALDMDGVVFVGDFAKVSPDTDISIVFDKDGVGTMTGGDESEDFTWEMKDDTTITLKSVESEDSDASSSNGGLISLFDNATEIAGGSISDVSDEADADSFDIAFEDGVMTFDLSEGSTTFKMFFTEDGTYAEYPIIDESDAEAITSESDIVGAWKMDGMIAEGITVYGDISELAGIAMDLELKDGGAATAVANGQSADASWAVSSSGATLTLSGQELELTMLGDKLLMDLAGQGTIIFAK